MLCLLLISYLRLFIAGARFATSRSISRANFFLGFALFQQSAIFLLLPVMGSRPDPRMSAAANDDYLLKRSLRDRIGLESCLAAFASPHAASAGLGFLRRRGVWAGGRRS